MWRILLLFVLVTSSVVQCDHHLCPSGYSRGQYLDASTQKYLLCWKVDWSDRSITFSAKVATTGWIGLGFSPTGFMPNSDVVIGWVKDGQGYLKVGTTPCFCIRSAAYSFVSQDRFATARSQPPIDDIQNVRLLSFSEADGMTTLEFKRDLEACEPKDRSIEVIARDTKILNLLTSTMSTATIKSLVECAIIDLIQQVGSTCMSSWDRQGQAFETALVTKLTLFNSSIKYLHTLSMKVQSCCFARRARFT